MAAEGAACKLIELGFWSLDSHSATAERPFPATLQDEKWSQSEEAHLVLQYVRRAAVESYELAPSWCRFNCQLAKGIPRVMGCTSQSDGAFVWPEGYAHYLEYHSVKPPAAFLRHINRVVAALQLGESLPLAAIPSPSSLALERNRSPWCFCCRRRVAHHLELTLPCCNAYFVTGDAIPRDTLTYLKASSTLCIDCESPVNGSFVQRWVAAAVAAAKLPA